MNKSENILLVKLFNMITYIMCNPNESRDLKPICEQMSVKELNDYLVKLYNKEQKELKDKPLKLFEDKEVKTSGTSKSKSKSKTN